MSASVATKFSEMASPEKPGAALRAFRVRMGWTLADVSERTGLQVSTLSKLENEKISFSYDKLMKVARGLGMDIAQLLSPEAVQPLGRRSISRGGSGVVVNSGTYEYAHLAADLLDKKFVPMIGEIRAQSLEEFGEMIRHPGEEFAYVVKGTLEFHTSLYAPVLLEQGDSIYFDSDTPHAYVNAGEGQCIVMAICSDVETGRHIDEPASF